MATNFKTRLNSVPSQGEFNNGEVLVKPDLAFEIPDVLTQIKRGIGGLMAKNPVYNPDHQLRDLHTYDLVEVQEMKDSYKEKQASAKSRLGEIDKISEKNEKAKEREALKAELKAEAAASKLADPSA